MLKQRVLVALVMAAVGFPAVLLGGYFYFAFIAVLLVMAAWEFCQVFRAAGFNACMPLLVGGVLLLLIARGYFPEFAPALLALLVLGAMTWHLIDYERGRDPAATDFTVTLGGILYLGWIGGYFIDLRGLEGGSAWLDAGAWWVLLVLLSVMLADTGAYFIGKRFGKHLLSPRLSPKKTWEGYWGGVVAGILAGALIAGLCQVFGLLDVTWWQGALLAAALALITPLGDLGESMLKRQANLKDSSSLIPGHGGFLDRIDSWLWAAVLGYYLVVWFFI